MQKLAINKKKSCFSFNYLIREVSDSLKDRQTDKQRTHRQTDKQRIRGDKQQVKKIKSLQYSCKKLNWKY